jgi:organic hydroperoxide reductase OsmC/OhrA
MGIYTTVTKGTQENIELETSSDKKPNLAVTPPPEFKGPEGYWTPEDLFSSAISSCYLLTFKAIARMKKMDWISLEVKVDAKLEKSKSGLKFTEVKIYPHLEICCDFNVDPYLELLMKSKDNCLVTNSMNCDFEVIPKIKVRTKSSIST